MNTKQMDAWKDLVQQCETQCAKPFYSSINVASKVRSDAIVAAGALVELVTPELPELLEQLARYANCYNAPVSAWDARTLAASIRKALEVDSAS